MQKRTIRQATPTTPYVVYINFPSSTKEYCYLCNIPNISPGDFVIVNGTKVVVHRVASFDSQATKYVTSITQHNIIERKKALAKQLLEIEKVELFLHRVSKLKSPQAKKLVKQLKELL